MAETLAELASKRLTPSEHWARCRGTLRDPLAMAAFVAVFDDPGGAAVPGPLSGAVCAVKELIDIDSSVVRRIRSVGAVIIGKTRADELGLGTFTPGVPNPWDPERTVGGSSGGSAVAVATGAADFALATDTAGSARIPAACAGVAGVCLGADWQGRDGIVGLSPVFDRLGLIAASGADLALLWRAAGGPVASATSVAAGRVWVLAAAALGRVDQAWGDAASQAAKQLAEAWGTGPVRDLPSPSFAAFGAPRSVVVIADAAHTRTEYQPRTALVRTQLASRRSRVQRDEAAAELDRLGAQLRAVLRGDLLVLPTLPGPPPRWTELTTVDDQLRALGRMTRLCGPVNSSGLVAASVPYGFDDAGLPIGVQVVGAEEVVVLNAAAELSSSATS